MGRVMCTLFALVLACTPVQYPPPKAVLVLDVSELSSVQAAVVHEAAESLTRQTEGCVVFKYGGGMRILPMVPVDKYDHTDPQRTNTLGMTTPGDKIELAFGKFVNTDIAVVVAAHELLHGLGVRHVENRYSLMFPNINSARLALSKEDRRELLIMLGCN